MSDEIGVEGGVGVEGLDRVLRALERLSGRDFQRYLQAGLRGVGEEIRDKLAVYPLPPKYPLRWASEKQAFYVKRILRKSLGPYIRRFDPMSQNLGQSWAVEVESPLRVIVGTTVTYAPYVQSAEYQQPFHADTGWVTDEQAVQKVRESGVIDEMISVAIERALRG